MRVLLAAALAAGLAGCASGTEEGETRLSGLLDLAVEDVRAARASAEAWGDVNAVACYDALEPFVSGLADRPTTEVKGAVSAFQKARNARRLAEAGVPDAIKVPCAVLVMDARDTVRGLALRALPLF